MRSHSTQNLIRQLMPLILRGGPGRWIAVLLLVGVLGWSLISPQGRTPVDSGPPIVTNDAGASRFDVDGSRSEETSPREPVEGMRIEERTSRPPQANVAARDAREQTSSRRSARERGDPQQGPPAATRASAESVSKANRGTTTASGDLDRPSQEAGELTEGPRGVFRSSAGLVYGPGSRDGHRLKHVMAHCRDEPGRPGMHGVFSVDRQEDVVALLDEAYQRTARGRPLARRRDEQERTVWTVDMERSIGYVGGQVGNRRGRPTARHVRLVLEEDRVITAYPVVP